MTDSLNQPPALAPSEPGAAAPTVLAEPSPDEPLPNEPSYRERFAAATRWHPLIAGAFATAMVLLMAWGRVPAYNNHVLLADAFNHGRIAINFPGDYIDALPWNGLHYVIEGPLPAVLLMPFVFLFGTDFNQMLLGASLAGLAVAAAWRICQRLGLALVPTIALVAFFYAGTQLMWAAFVGDVWNLAHVSALAFTMLALAELLGNKRGWLVGVWAVCAFESRFSMAIVIPVYLYLLLTDAKEPGKFASRWRPRLFGISLVGALSLLAYVGYNERRWGKLTDIGYTEWYHRDQIGSPTGTPFQLRYLQHELYSFFIQGPNFHPGFPWVTPEVGGQAMLWTSPALVLVFLAHRPRRLTVAMWVAAVLAAAPNLIYYANGFTQFGMRHALDFEPFLFVLMALGVRSRFPRWGYILVGISVVIGLWGCWYWDVYYL